MKKLLFMIAAAALFASCGGRDYYFAKDQARAYNDPEAEFDTLSYAIGMNLGLNASLNYGSEGLPIDVLKDAFLTEITKSEADHAFLEANREELGVFQQEVMRPYMMKKRMIMFQKDSLKPTLMPLFNEEYPAERIATLLGHDMAQYVRSTLSEVNVHYLFEAMDDAMAIEEQSAIDEHMKLNTMQLQKILGQHYGPALATTIGDFSKEWIRGVAAKRDVEMLVVGADTLYYRIENAGSEVRPTRDTDTVSLRFEGYSCRGVLFESTAKRANDVRKHIEKLQADTTITDEVRADRIAKYEEQIAATEQPTIPLRQLRIPGAIEALQLVGVGGDITVWMPAELAYGVRGNRAVLPGEAIVMHFELKDVKPGLDIFNKRVQPGKSVVEKAPEIIPAE